MQGVTKKVPLTKYMTMLVFRLALNPDKKNDGFAKLDEDKLALVEKSKKRCAIRYYPYLYIESDFLKIP